MRHAQILKAIDPLVGRLGMLLPRPEGKPGSVPQSVLFIRPGGIGDAVLLVPAIRAFRARYPDVAVDILAERRNAGVFSLCPEVRLVCCYDIPTELLSILRSRYDIVIDTEQWHRLSSVVARIVRADVRIGFATNDRSRFFSNQVSYDQDDYEADSFMHLLSPLGYFSESEVSVPFLSISARDSETVASFLAPLGGDPFAALFPGASIAERRWGADRFWELADRLRKGNIAAVIVGGAGDRDDAESIEQAGALNLAGKTTLAETAAIIARSSLLVSGDSGILHIAVGLGIPTVSLFGPGRAQKWAPRGASHIVINRNLPCSPCTTFGYTPKCPINARCMAEISVDEVEQAVMTLLARKFFTSATKALTNPGAVGI